MSAPPTYEVLGCGSYGCTLRPALPNVSPNTGEDIEYTGDRVSKVFFSRNAKTGRPLLSKEYANAAVERSRRLREYGIENTVEPYTRKFKGNNIPKVPQLNGKINPENNIGVIRSKYMGFDLSVVYSEFVTGNREGPLLDAIKKLPLLDLLEQGVMPVFDTLQKLRTKKRLHLDIKMENIMILPLTGEMNIIDYDFEDDNEKIKSFRFGVEQLLNYPPETVLWLSVRAPEGMSKVYDGIYDRWFDQIRTIDEIFVVDGKYTEDPDLQPIIDNIVSPPEYNYGILQGYLSRVENDAQLRELSIDTFDSYCTAVSLLIFFCVYLNLGTNWTTYKPYLKPLLEGILIPMMRFDIKGRMPIEAAIPMLKSLISLMTADGAESKLKTPIKPRQNPAIPPVIPRTPVKKSRAELRRRAPVGKRSYKISVAGGTRKKLKSSRRTKKGRRRA